jgi:hypothetical protein
MTVIRLNPSLEFDLLSASPAATLQAKPLFFVKISVTLEALVHDIFSDFTLSRIAAFVVGLRIHRLEPVGADRGDLASFRAARACPRGDGFLDWVVL